MRAASMACHPAGKALDFRVGPLDGWDLIGPGSAAPFRAQPQDNQLDVGLFLEQGLGPLPVSEFEESVHDLLGELAAILLSKQADYGPGAINRAPGGALNGVLVRLHDKYERIRNLSEVGAAPQHESMRDSWVDLANYAVIALLVIDGRWPK